LRTRVFGLLTFGFPPYHALEREWRWAEELGFDSAWIPDLWTNRTHLHYETWALLAVLGRATSRMRVGTLVSTIVSEHPVVLSAQALTVDHVTGGRLEVGIGAGGRTAEADLFGTPQLSADERGARFDEYVLLLDRLLRGDATGGTARYPLASDTRLVTPLQRPRPPLVVAAETSRSLRVAARFGDAWCTLGAWAGGGADRLADASALAATRSRIAEFDALCATAGRDPRSVRRMILSYRREVDALSSIDAFDEFVGGYAELGIEEFVFYWPPLASVRERREPSLMERETVERIAAGRFGRTGAVRSTP